MPKVVSNIEGSPKKKRRWLRRLTVGFLGLIGLLILFFFGSIAFDSLLGSKATEFTNITYEATDGTTLHAYLATPEGEGPHPAVLMFHEWWGINEDITKLADALAEEGFVVLAPDAYRGNTTAWFPRALWLVTQTDQAIISADIDDAYTYLTSLDEVDADRIGSTGFCFGGRQSLFLAMRQGENIAAASSFYGTALTDPDDIAMFDQDVPLLTIWGRDDGSIPVDSVEEMGNLMDQSGLDHQLSIYDGVGHAFVNSENYEDGGAPGDAWQEMVDFLKSALFTETSARDKDLASTTTNWKPSQSANVLELSFCLVDH